MLKLIGIFSIVSFLLSYAKIFKYRDIQNTSLTPDKELNNILNAFSCHYIQELYTFKNGPVFYPPCTYEHWIQK